ncbi:hypothetical protein NE683_03745 [Bariatricus massiliensis]|uniref:Uncharacterized protein n=1 Tax=Bariatricus massiliensis TaxID=1745713 RepID=A0ABS8DCR6_9FIRM|nr:hypothetical protein [Bariatricus massiliensis]MCB7303416.1 hypothetical protein [Bariatricus massiliensis]MCB7373548.1 hypothetical protein [Bariatricus massiliensis]MCB7386218.1 hypothetical protein [Bariatricus massiliensis]MCB7410380.1 hypothetical protein [Bariatricus massiliensis]MCQ5252336.1 hypothetical protein [Bariatricus massiliensis]
MGSLILCHKKKAKHPYEISRIHRRVYTIEELCYYLCNNLYLIDYTIINEQLCKWIEDELELKELSELLLELLKNHGSVEQFVLHILNASGIYTQGELAHIQNVLEKLKNQKEVERQKFKADSLMESGELESAILVYMSIVNGERDESVDSRFYGRVYACLAGAYGRAFLYEESARMYEKAYRICEDSRMLEGYLYACYRYLPVDEYQKMITENDVLLDVDNKLAAKIAETRDNISIDSSRELLEEWKKEYRRR